MENFWLLIKKIQQDKYYGFSAAALLVIVAIHLNLTHWYSSFWGWLFFAIYLSLNSAWLSLWLAKVFNWTRGWSYFFGIFLLLNLASLFLSVPLTLFRYQSGLIALVFLLITLILRIGVAWPRIKNQSVEPVDKSLNDVLKKGFPVNKYFLLILPSLFMLGWWFLLQGRTGEFILSPWEVIPRLYLYIYLVLTTVLVLLLFSRRKARLILLLIILHSFLLHAYLPLVYQTGFSGDKWRHLASEKLILTGEVYQPALIGEVEYTTLGSFSVPAVLLSGNKTSYGQQWSLTILLSEVLQVDLFYVDLWLVWLLWSIFLPPLLYKLAELIRPGRNFRLFFALAPALFYPFQVFGGLTLPVSLGHLLFMFVLYIWIYFYRHGSKAVLAWAVFLSLLMYFGYILHLIVIWELAGLVIIFKYLQHPVPKFIRWGLKALVVGGLIVLIPVLEFIQGYGSLREGILGLGAIISHSANAFGHLSGLVGFLPQPGHVDQGNFLFNQTRADHAPVSLLSFRLWPLLFTMLVWLVIIYGLRTIRWLKQPGVPKLFAWLFMIVISNYVISWYFMDGNHILARRLDQVIVFLMSVFLSLGTMYFVERIKFLPWANKVLLIAILFGFISSSTYASGPNLQVVTADEHLAAKYVWEQVDKSDEYYCVIANTWPLLALEAESARAIIGGGFPVGFEYAQPERVKIFEKMSQYPSWELLTWAKEITNEQVCFYMTEDRWINDRVYQETIKLFGPPEKVIGEVMIWRY